VLCSTCYGKGLLNTARIICTPAVENYLTKSLLICGQSYLASIFVFWFYGYHILKRIGDKLAWRREARFLS
jgi:hypothetical protein